MTSKKGGNSVIDWLAARMIGIGGAAVMAVVVWEVTREERAAIARLFQRGRA